MKSNTPMLLKLGKCLSSATKIMILIHLYTCTCNFCNVATFIKSFKRQQSNISNHLLDLRRMGWVDFTRHGREHRYKLNPEIREELSEFFEWLLQYRNGALKRFMCSCSMSN